VSVFGDVNVKSERENENGNDNENEREGEIQRGHARLVCNWAYSIYL
jgi:hypothetical protein